MRSRIQRFRTISLGSALQDLVKNQQYELEISSKLLVRIRNGEFNQILFVGYGCSSVPCEVLRALFDTKGIRLPLICVSAHNFDTPYYQTLVQPSTLVFVCSFSGNTRECVMAFEYLSKLAPDRLIALVGGGELYEQAPNRIKWKIEDMDSEYPIFHLPQIVAILLRLLYTLGLTETDFFDEYQGIMPTPGIEQQGKALGTKLRDVPITLICPYTSSFLAKIMEVYLSEIAMIKANIVDIHEFGHVYVAACTRMIARQGFLLFEDASCDTHTIERYANVTNTLTGRNCVIASIVPSTENFFQKFIDGMTLCNWIVYELAAYYDIADENLISGIVKNTAYLSQEAG